MGSMPYPALQSMFDTIYPHGLQWYWKGDFFGEIPDRAIDEHLKFGERVPTLHSAMQLNPVDGAVSRGNRHDTAFSYRDAKWSMVIVGVDPDPANAEKITGGKFLGWCRKTPPRVCSAWAMVFVNLLYP
jgi:hypothetical protein